MSEPRRPAAFRIDTPPDHAPAGKARPAPEARRPRAVDPAKGIVVKPAEIDVFEAEIDDAAPPPLPLPRKSRRARIARVFLLAFGTLVSLAIGLWTDSLIRDLFARSDWLGWLAVGAAGVAAASLVVIVAREMLALRRLASVEILRRRAADILQRNDMREARSLVDDLSGFLASRPETAAGRRSLADLRGEIIDGADLVRLAETELLVPLDERAKALVLDAGKRVSIVTAVSPRALVDIAYVTFEAARLIRRISELYGARPGTLGFLRLVRGVLAHLAVTGSIAATDSFVQEIVGQGLAARLSAKLGEGVVNGVMTVRIGIAAIDTVRPLPFSAVKRPGVSDFLAALSRFGAARPG